MRRVTLLDVAFLDPLEAHSAPRTRKAQGKKPGLHSAHSAGICSRQLSTGLSKFSSKTSYPFNLSGCETHPNCRRFCVSSAPLPAVFRAVLGLPRPSSWQPPQTFFSPPLPGPALSRVHTWHDMLQLFQEAKLMMKHFEQE